MTSLNQPATALPGEPEAAKTITKAITLECLGNQTNLIQLNISWVLDLSASQRGRLERSAETMLRTFYLELSESVCPR